MSKADWGTKRSCPKCNSHFYDLGKNPAHCPKCKHEFDPAALQKPRRGRSRKVADDLMNKSSLDALKKIEPKKKITKKVEDVDLEGFEEPVEGLGDIEEIEEIDDNEAVEEIADIEEDETANTDDADDESIIEDMSTGDKSLIDKVEDEEDSDEKE